MLFNKSILMQSKWNIVFQQDFALTVFFPAHKIMKPLSMSMYYERTTDINHTWTFLFWKILIQLFPHLHTSQLYE